MDDFTLLSASAVSMLLEAGPQFEEFLERCMVPGGPVRRFPNGAIEINEQWISSEEREEAFRMCATPGHAIEGAYVFQNLGPYPPKRYYVIQYPEAYQAKLRSEDSFQVGRGRVRPPFPGEFNLDRLEVTVAARSRFTKKARLAFVDAISDWAATVSAQGVFDDGPISIVSSDIAFSGTRASFLIDARQSGQDTLNWLALAIFDFGENVHTTTGIYFGAPEEFLNGMIGPPQGDWELVAYHRKMPVSPSKSPISPDPDRFVPAEATPDPFLASKTFPVLNLPYNEWDSLYVTIYLGRSSSESERTELAAIIEAWKCLATFGAFDGRGPGHVGPLQFVEETDSVTFRADMGDVDPTIALPILIKALTGYEMSGPSIDALVFGRLK